MLPQKVGIILKQFPHRTTRYPEQFYAHLCRNRAIAHPLYDILLA